MKLVKEGLPVDAVTAGTCSCRVAALNHEVLDHTMEHGPIVVPLKAKLDEVAAGTGCLSRPQVYLELTVVGLQYHLGRSWRLL